MEGTNLSDESQYRPYNPQSSPGFAYSSITSKMANMRNAMKVIRIGNVDFVAVNPMYKMMQDVQDIQATAFGSKNTPTLTAKYLNQYETGQASASNYSDSAGVETPQSLASGFDTNVESGQNSTGYNSGNQELFTNYYGGIPGQEVVDNWYPESWIDPAMAANYQSLGLAMTAANYNQELPVRKVTNFFPTEEAVTALAAGAIQGPKTSFTALADDYPGVKNGQAPVKTSKFKGGAMLVMPDSTFGSQQKKVDTLGLPAVLRADLWPKDHEAYLMALKDANYKFPEISTKMFDKFGIQRSPNVLSKRYRLILERDAEDSGIMQLLKGATPKLLRVLHDEMEKLDPEVMNEDLRREVWEELQRNLPKVVRTLALQTRTGAA